ncbi:uncharacterized protein LOC126942841 isoform X1 [Macaca thibetana thibetana]|uniref:uncharacterized protein LOC126942841 isoform X1 n=1 Tax=Macaca thibetana thibetana TaxID=257877 RepID=UPI0021BCF40E|nr:uncharacterized protein LOC126942841 isoform X1 [Macaca thibetana thibetana]
MDGDPPGSLDCTLGASTGSHRSPPSPVSLPCGTASTWDARLASGGGPRGHCDSSAPTTDQQQDNRQHTDADARAFWGTLICDLPPGTLPCSTDTTDVKMQETGQPRMKGPVHPPLRPGPTFQKTLRRTRLSE